MWTGQYRWALRTLVAALVITILAFVMHAQYRDEYTQMFATDDAGSGYAMMRNIFAVLAVLLAIAAGVVAVVVRADEAALRCPACRTRVRADASVCAACRSPLTPQRRPAR